MKKKKQNILQKEREFFPVKFALRVGSSLFHFHQFKCRQNSSCLKSNGVNTIPSAYSRWRSFGMGLFQFYMVLALIWTGLFCFCCDIHANFYSDGKDSQKNHKAVNSPVTSVQTCINMTSLSCCPLTVTPCTRWDCVGIEGGTGSVHCWHSLLASKALQHFLLPNSLHFTRYI